MIILYFLLTLCIGNCYTDELFSDRITCNDKINHTHIISERENINHYGQVLVRLSRQNEVSQVKQNPKVEAPKSQTPNKDSKSEKPTEQKMKPRTNSHKNSHSAPSRRANIAASLKQKIKQLVKTRPISKLYSKIKQFSKKVSSKARSFVKGKLAGLKKKFSNLKQSSKKISSKKKTLFKQLQKRFQGLKSKYFSKAKYLSKNALKAKVKFEKRGKHFLQKANRKLSGLRSKFISKMKHNSFSKLKKNFIPKISKITKKIFKKLRPTISSCGIKRSKRATKCSPENAGITDTDNQGNSVNPHSPNRRVDNYILDPDGFRRKATDEDYEKEIDGEKINYLLMKETLKG
jgi:hypothetical protein